LNVLVTKGGCWATVAAASGLFWCFPALAQNAVAFQPDGTTHVENLSVPISPSISPEAAAMLKRRNATPDMTNGLPVAEIRQLRAPRQAKSEAELLQRFPATVEKKTIAGVVVRIVTPAKLAPGSEHKLLINVHGGAFIVGQGSIGEAIPIATLTGIPVLAIDYRLAPENPFPAGVDDTVAVYRELLKQYKADQMGLYGSSAGAVLAAEATVKLRQLGLPAPAALGFFSGTADWARPGDTEGIFGIVGFAKRVIPILDQAQGYTRGANLKDPVLSPIYADLKGFPATLCMSGTRDFFLSATTNFHRALLRSGVEANLVVFDAMPHVHWTESSLPETEEALKIQAEFLAKHLK
jgi:monoterpene epsilon-lactone hydrolase